MIINSQGLSVTIENSGGTPQTIGHLNTFSITGTDSTENDVTTFASEGFKEFRPGLRDPGTVELGGFFDPQDAGQAECDDAATLQAVREFVVTVDRDGSPVTCTFEGFVKSITTEAQPDGQIGTTISIRRTGETVWA